jgi:hypothetical protein
MGAEDLLWELLENSSCCGAIHSSEALMVATVKDMRRSILDEVYEKLREELVARDEEKETIRIRLGAFSYRRNVDEHDFVKLCGRVEGAAKCMEIVEAMYEG